MAAKLYPFGIANAISSSFKLLLLAEGFTAGQRPHFSSLCHEFVEAMLATTPFNRTRARPEWLTVIKVFLPSVNAGPRIGPPSAHSTALGSFVDAASKRLVVDHVRLGTVLAAQTLTTASGAVRLSEIFGHSGVHYGANGALIAVVTPAIADPDGADDHVLPALEGEYHAVATTANGLWHQVILRGIGASLGLIDEFELATPAFAQAAEDSIELANAPNVVFSDTPPAMNSDFPAWGHLMSAAEWLLPADVHPHPAGDNPNTAVPAAPYSEGRISFWEGGAGYRRKIYRSAEDCLMRRAPGRGVLPARAGAVAFCPVCRAHIQSAIGG
jgi:hypothetical protein